MDDDPSRTNLGGSRDLLLQNLPARNPDPVVARGDVDDIRGVDIDAHTGLFGLGLQPGCAIGVWELRALPPLGIAQKELHAVRANRGGLADRIILAHMSAEKAGKISHEAEPTCPELGPGQSPSAHQANHRVEVASAALPMADIGCAGAFDRQRNLTSRTPCVRPATPERIFLTGAVLGWGEGRVGTPQSGVV